MRVCDRKVLYNDNIIGRSEVVLKMPGFLKHIDMMENSKLVAILSKVRNQLSISQFSYDSNVVWQMALIVLEATVKRHCS